ncbi:MAG: hypothetical protein WCL49_13300 [bacterium]
MTTPRFRHWVRSSGPKVASGLLIGIGIVVLVVVLFLKPDLYAIGFPLGISLILLGAAGLALASQLDIH